MFFLFSGYDIFNWKFLPGPETRCTHSQLAIKYLIYINIKWHSGYLLNYLTQENKIVITIHIFIFWSYRAGQYPFHKRILPVVPQINSISHSHIEARLFCFTVYFRIGKPGNSIDCFFIERNKWNKPCLVQQNIL